MPEAVIKTASADEVLTEDIQTRAERLGLSVLRESPKDIAQDVKNLVTEDIARKYHMVAFAKSDNLVSLAMVDPEDFEALNVLRFLAENAKIEFQIYLTTPQVLEEILEQFEGPERAIAAAVQSLKDSDLDEMFSENTHEVKSKQEEVLQDAPVTKLLGVVIKHAVEGKASDIHIELTDKKYRVRFRVDGILHSSLVVPKEVGRALISRIKILSNLKIDEKRKPQDGRFRVTENGKSVDFRVSTMPVVDGEKAVLRLLDTGNKTTDPKDMGLIGKNYDVLMAHIRDPYGIILITGPTGSGKSTTLYSFLQILNQEERNIVTLEDPVEYSIEGINQSQIQPEIGYTFASGLRSILRQDPNVIMVGEIRDNETAELTIHAALTGHLVFSTLHTNSSIGAIPRLVDMGIEPFLLSSSLQVVAAQRLVRRICEHCKEEVKVPHSVSDFVQKEVAAIDPQQLVAYEVDLSKELKFYQGKGCEECGNTGYKGRVAIFEALEIDEDIKEIIAERHGNEVDIEKAAFAKKMMTIRQDGILKVLKGLTTISEVERVTEGSLSVGGEVDDDRG